MLTFIEDIIIQSDPEKQDKNQISEKFFYNASDSELKFSQRVRFWIKFFTTRQILSYKFYDASDFGENCFLKSMTLKKKLILESTILKKKIFLRSRFWKNSCTQKVTFWLILPSRMRKLCVLRAYLKSTILKKKLILKSTFLKRKKFLKSTILKKKFLQKAWFWIKNFSCCQSLK